MKNLFTLLILTLLTTVAFQQESFACWNASITGPSGRCGAPAGVPTTYTGTHGFTSSGCTVYEWQATGGSISVGGATVTSGQTICVVENLSCVGGTIFDCFIAVVDPAVASGNGASISVTWNQGVVGELKLKVKEKGEITLSGSDDIVNDISVPTPSSISVSNRTNSSATFTANFDDALCPGMVVNWTINGNPAGSGNPRSLPIGYCTSNAQVCASVSQGNITSPSVCRSFIGSLTSSLNGPYNATTNSFVNFTVNSTQPMTSINWFAQPASSVFFFPPTDGAYVDLYFTATGTIDICVQASTVCGQQFLECRQVNVTNFAPNAIGSTPTVKVPETAATTLRDGEYDQSNPLQGSELIVFPTLIDQQQDLQIQLPTEATEATLFLTDINGRLLVERTITDQSSTLSTDQLSAGMYFITARSGKWSSTKKIVVR